MRERIRKFLVTTEVIAGIWRMGLIICRTTGADGGLEDVAFGKEKLEPRSLEASGLRMRCGVIPAS